MPTIRTSCRGGSSDVPAGRWQNRSSTAGSAVGSSPRGHSWRIIADSHGHQRLLVQLLNGQMGAASPGPEQHLHALPQQRSPCRGNGAGGRLPPIALTLGGGLPAESSSRRAGSGHPGGSSEDVQPTPIPKEATRRSTRPLTYSDETGFAEQQGRMMKALAPSRRRWSPEAARSSSHALSSHSDGHLGPHDAAGAQTITDGPFGRIKGDDADAPQPGCVPQVASNNRCGSLSAFPVCVGDRA
jgi:hypothetical protein